MKFLLNRIIIPIFDGNNHHDDWQNCIMKEYSTMELRRMTDDRVIKVIGEYIHTVRLEKNLTQVQLGERAGVHRTTIRDLEWGKRSTLLTLIQVLRSLDHLQVLKNFKVSVELSPLELAKLEVKRRKRASGSVGDGSKRKSDW